MRGRQLYWSYQYKDSNGWDASQVATLHTELNYVVSAKFFSDGQLSFSGYFEDYRKFWTLPFDRREMVIDSILQGFTSESCEILVREDFGEWSHPDSVTAIDNIPEFDTLTGKRLRYVGATATVSRFEDLPPFLRKGGVTHYFHFTPFTGQDVHFQLRYQFRRQNGTTESVVKQLHYQWRLTPIGRL